MSERGATERYSRELLAVVICVAACLARTPSAQSTEREIQDAVVQIFTVYDEHDYYRPWQMRGKMSKTGSGCIIDGKRILTNAHVVADQTFIQVERAGKAEKFVARVLFVAHECDLALLTVADDRFFEGSKPVRLGELSTIRDRVAVYGFPAGGTKIAITEGVVSRVQNLFYSHSQAELLACQIDAPINPGSSGGPVLNDGKLVGVAFQSMAGENIGYMVPAPVVRHFLTDIEDGRFDGFPSLGISYQKMESPDLRAASLMPAGLSGVLVNRAYPRSPCRGILEPGDVILSIDGRRIANDGTVEFRGSERTHFEYIAQQRQINDSLSMEILRKGTRQSVSVRLSIASNAWQLVPRQQYDSEPAYFIYGGMVFVPLTANFLRTWGNNWLSNGPRRLVGLYLSEPDETREEVVVISQVLSDASNVGYESHVFSVVTQVNGRPVRGLADVVEACDTWEGEFSEIVDEDGYRITLSRRSALESKARILKRYRVTFDRSPGLGPRE